RPRPHRALPSFPTRRSSDLCGIIGLVQPLPATAAVLDQACAQGLIPVAVLDDAQAAVSLGRALHAAGGRVIEVTFRTSAAVRSIDRKSTRLNSSHSQISYAV